MPTQWSWQAPPCPATSFLPDGTDFYVPRERIWHRALWGVERGMSAMGFTTKGWPDMMVSAKLEIEPGARPLTIPDLRAALRILRSQHPIVATRLAADAPPQGSSSPWGEPRLVYETPGDEADVQRWLSDVVFDHEDELKRAGGNLDDAIDIVRREISVEIPAYRPSQLDVHCIRANEGRSIGLLLRYGHAAFDGIGTWTFLDVVVRKVAEVLGSKEMPQPSFAWGEEVVRLPIPAVENTRIPPDAGPSDKKPLMSEIMENAVRYTTSRKIVSLHTPHPHAEPTNTGYIHRTLPHPVVTALVREARRNGCTFFSAAYAAALLATLAIRRPQDAEFLANAGWAVTVNLRDKGVLLETKDVSCALGMGILTAKSLERFVHDQNVPVLEDVWILGREMGEQIDVQLKELPTIASWGHKLDVGALPQELREAMFKRDTSRMMSPTLSSMGVIDRYLAPRHGHVTVSDPFMTIRCVHSGAPTGPVPGIHAYTWQGTLHISVSYPEAVVGTHEEQVQALLNEPEAQGSFMVWANTFVETLERIAGVVTRE